MSNLTEAIRKIGNTSVNTPIVGKVISVDGNLCDIEPINGESNILDVRLQASTGNGVLIIPAIDSYVIVDWINHVTGYVAMYSQVDSIQLMDGTHGGLVKIADLVTKLNNVENDLNTLKTAFSSWVVVPSDGGAALKAISASWYGASLTPTARVDLENDIITHGDV